MNALSFAIFCNIYSPLRFSVSSLSFMLVDVLSVTAFSTGLGLASVLPSDATLFSVPFDGALGGGGGGQSLDTGSVLWLELWVLLGIGF